MKTKQVVRFACVLVVAALMCAFAPGPATAVPVSAGTATIPGTWLFDFDAGVIPPSAPFAGADIWWEQVTGTTRFVEPWSSATLVNLGVVSFSSITFTQLQSLAYGTAPINGSDVGSVLVPGDVFAVHTDLGNYAKVLVTGPFDQTRNHGLPIQWVTVNQTHQEEIVTNAPPTLTCPAATVVECGTEAELTAQISDPEGDAMTVVWTLNGTAIRTNLVPASPPGTVTDISISGFFPLGTNILAMRVTDGTNVASCTTRVTVVDTTPPVLSHVVASPTVLWPPNHKLVRVTLRASVSDLGGPAAWSIIGVQCNEPANARGDGNTSPDWSIAGEDTVFLRAERSGSGDSRIYSVEVQATDASGNRSETQRVTVTVPKSLGRGK